MLCCGDVLAEARATGPIAWSIAAFFSLQILARIGDQLDLDGFLLTVSRIWRNATQRMWRDLISLFPPEWQFELADNQIDGLTLSFALTLAVLVSIVATKLMTTKTAIDWFEPIWNRLPPAAKAGCFAVAYLLFVGLFAMPYAINVASEIIPIVRWHVDNMAIISAADRVRLAILAALNSLLIVGALLGPALYVWSRQVPMRIPKGDGAQMILGGLLAIFWGWIAISLALIALPFASSYSASSEQTSEVVSHNMRLLERYAQNEAAGLPQETVERSIQVDFGYWPRLIGEYPAESLVYASVVLALGIVTTLRPSVLPRMVATALLVLLADRILVIASIAFNPALEYFQDVVRSATS